MKTAAFGRDWCGTSCNWNTWVRSLRSRVGRNCILDIVELGNVEKRDHRELAVSLVEHIRLRLITLKAMN